MKIEIEYKLELSEVEFLSAQKIASEKTLSSSWVFKKESDLEDYLYDFNQVDEKKWDFKRIRVYDKKEYEKTEKLWLIKNGEFIRQETESPSNQEELDQLTNYLKINKKRTDYSLNIDSIGSSTLSLDKVIFPDETRYFVEIEINDSQEKDQIKLRETLRKWLLLTFNLSDRPEGIGMMRLVLSKIK